MVEAAHVTTRPNHTGIGMTSARTRDRLVQRLRDQGITDLRVLERIRALPRHIFVDEALASRATKTLRSRSAGVRRSRSLHRRANDESLLQGGPLKKVLEIGSGCAIRPRCWRHLPNASFGRAHRAAREEGGVA